MESLSPRLIESGLAGYPAARIYIAYSGGVDSHVLLHLCASLPALKNNITAIYVHHGLQAEADSWAEHCENTARLLAVDFKILNVNAHAASGESPEEAARNARYTALKALMSSNDALLLAQHREDQLETVLLQLFRGGGLRGLSGMPQRTPFGPGIMLRPLLNVSKQAIDDYAKTHALNWVEDPSNLCSDYDRNFLRNNIIPLLKSRWPTLDKTVARSAGHCAEAQGIIAEVAEDWLHEVFDHADNTLLISRLKTYPAQRQKLLIRQWFEYLGLKMPSQSVLTHIQRDVLAAREDGEPVLVASVYCVRRYRDKLYCLPLPELESLLDIDWPKGQASLQISPQHRLNCIPSSAGILREHWQNARVEVRFRSGGEKIRLPRREGRHALKKLFQEAGIPPWERKKMPLIYLDGQLAAVSDHWISAEFYHEQTDACVMLVSQQQHPAIAEQSRYIL